MLKTVGNHPQPRLHLPLTHLAGYELAIFDQHPYDRGDGYKLNPRSTAASVDENKVFRASYGNELQYQRLAYEAREAWKRWNDELGPGRELFVASGMLRVQHARELDESEKRTLENMAAEGLRDTQFVLSSDDDQRRAQERGWAHKLLRFAIPKTDVRETFEAVLDSTAGYVYPSRACAYLADKLRKKGAEFVEGAEEGEFASFVVAGSGDSKRVTGIRTKDGKEHFADLVIMACKRPSCCASPLADIERRRVCNTNARPRSEPCPRGHSR